MLVYGQPGSGGTRNYGRSGEGSLSTSRKTNSAVGVWGCGTRRGLPKHRMKLLVNWKNRVVLWDAATFIQSERREERCTPL